jgi:hypothetical protein
MRGVLALLSDTSATVHWKRMTPALSQQNTSLKRTLGCFFLMLVGVYLASATLINLSKFHVQYSTNPSFQEAIAWRNGHINLPSREPDTALYKGHFYSIHPPMFTILSYVALSLGAVQGVPPDEFYPPWLIMMTILPLPIVGFWAFQQVLKWPEWSAVLTGNWLLGTALLPTIQLSQDGFVNPLNHVLSSTGLILIAGDLVGGRRFWPAAIGLMIAGWSRPHLLIFAIPVLWLALHTGRKCAILSVLLSVTVTAGTLALLNYLKFDSPFESGYRYIYDYRPNSFLGSRFYEHGLFSIHFLPDNLKTLFLIVPEFRLTQELLTPERTEWGASFWITTPLLLALIPDVRRWWRDAASRGLFLSSLGVIAFFLFYHSRGASTHGFHFYPLDFIPVWLVILAPWTTSPNARAITLTCFCYSALYFNFCCR